jgi:branched-chain amino acid transport system permease protein
MVDVGIWALIYGIAAIGLSLLMGLAGQVSLGHAAFIAVGAYTQALLDCVPRMGAKLPRLKAIDYDVIEKAESWS